MKAIIPLGGRGSRIFPLGISGPKCLLRLLNKPLLLWTIEALAENKIYEIVLIINPNEFGEKIKKYINSLSLKKVKLHFAIQEEPLGTGHAMNCASKFFKKGEKLLFINGDDLYSSNDIKKLLRYPFSVMTKKVKDPSKWGVCKISTNNYLKEIIEKPTTLIGHLANIGCYYVDSRVFDLYKKTKKSSRGEYEITDVINLFAKIEKVKTVESTDYWQPLGYPWHYLEATELLGENLKSDIQGKIEKYVTINGKIILPKSSTIRSGTYIDGNLIVGENSIVGPNVLIRGNVVVGNNTLIRFGTDIKNSTIGDNCNITQSYIGDSVFGNNVNFPISVCASYQKSIFGYEVIDKSENVKTLIKDRKIDTGHDKFGAIIGDNAQIGIHTIIFPGIKIWPNTYTSPGEIIKKDLVNQWS